MTKQTEALSIAIEALLHHTQQTRPIEYTNLAIQACKDALEPTVAELNDEYLRDTHVEGLSTNSKANEIIKTQHWLCLDGQMVVAQLYNLVEILNDPMKAYPHNFSTPAKGNALLFGLCQEAADEIERLKAETQEPILIQWYDEEEDVWENTDERHYQHYADTGHKIRFLYTTPPKAETQEPVAWMNDIAFSMDKELLGTRSRIVALYTTPPSREWVGLSDEEIKDVEYEYAYASIGFARGIEAKLREKNT